MSDAEKLAPLLARPGVRRVFAALDRDGEELRIVGGAVRNALLGEPVGDIDLASTAPPDVNARRAQKAGLKVAPTGVEHGTITVIVEGVPFEVTTLREDVETDGRRAKVRFGRDFAMDAQRRDFTLNALSLDWRGLLHDPVGGRADLEARRVRFIGAPRRRIAEDFLRILRFFRFSACYGAGLDPDGFDACVALRDGLDTLSRERLGAETLKLLAAPRAGFIAERMAQAGLLGYLGVAPWPARLKNLRPQGQRGDGLLSLAALALHSARDAETLSRALRLSNAQKQRLAGAARAAAFWHGATAAPSAASLREALFHLGPHSARDGLDLVRAEIGAAATESGFAQAQVFLRDTPPPRPPFRASDICARGIPKGPELGAALKTLQALWIRAGFPSDPQKVTQLIEQACAATPDSNWTRPAT
ncbi:poly(A) polymerase [Rhodoblastus acidophilus]|uniref:Poly(A) polymerase n=1 Tax=Rhodoblastus acidophilus TaxID=1074 RepID=A0A212RWH7_RHOAC|nr:CCA tRNA nucleotidyltransferase [Rhodoblastus acidophilus]PPQ38367.1 CCA tRNA nucleotidyltransferase [Rhodoblastus acidophilus]RAI20040.1 CCA tRNA nucleotidyltransferase [Rhodoblastus acidophilus]SNB76983.1 poly(A) polymerase [Rhodoblastus acidophilus]